SAEGRFKRGAAAPPGARLSWTTAPCSWRDSEGGRRADGGAHGERRAPQQDERRADELTAAAASTLASGHSSARSTDSSLPSSAMLEPSRLGRAAAGPPEPEELCHRQWSTSCFSGADPQEAGSWGYKMRVSARIRRAEDDGS
ncbi:unnamed protein product, partial [Prorocentrum cordatum]